MRGSCERRDNGAGRSVRCGAQEGALRRRKLVFLNTQYAYCAHLCINFIWNGNNMIFSNLYSLWEFVYFLTIKKYTKMNDVIGILKE